MDIKANIANNIVELRKRKKWTQAELAERINYTDKAVSKWERGESTPDVDVLYNMAEIFGVTVDYFFNENAIENIDKYMISKEIFKRRILQLLLILTSSLFIAICAFVYGNLRKIEHPNLWMVFIWIIPIDCLITTIFFKKINFIKGIPFSGSLLIWTLLAANYIHYLLVGYNIWLIFLIGIPLQIAIVLGSWLKK